MRFVLLLVTLSIPVLAQSDSSAFEYQTEDVVVTATRQNEKTIDVPFAVSNLSMDEIKLDRKGAVSDVLGTVPGVFMQSRYGNHDVRISIRGFGSRSNTGIRGVRILMDGIPESEPDGQTRIEAVDLNSIGSIEVVKGNSSSLYTNAPGGVINFRNNFNFTSSFANQYNEIASYGLRRNGVQLGLKSTNYSLLTTYTYHNFDGFRDHSQDYWNVLNTVFQTFPTNKTRLELLGYFVDGLIRLPGSLTKEEYLEDPYQTADREMNYDFRRVSKKGRIGITFNKILDELNEFEITAYGTIKYFERAQRDFRIMNRYGIGGSAKYIRNFEMFGIFNSLSLGGDIFHQSGPVETYKNLRGVRSDSLQLLTDETIANTGLYLSLNSDVTQKLSVLLTARLDNIIFDIKNQLNRMENASRNFTDVTPKIALNYKLTSYFAFYGSFGFSFDSPAGNEMDDYERVYEPGYNVKVLNPDLQPQESTNAELGAKGYFISGSGGIINNLYTDISLFNYLIKNEIVPFEVNGNVYYRNSAETKRQGIELGITADILKHINWKIAYTYSHFKYVNYSAYSFSSEGGPGSTIRDYAGNKVPSVPEHHLNTELIFSYPIVKYTNLYLKGNYNYVNSMFTDDANSESTESYSLLNSTVGIEFSTAEFKVLLTGSVNNITNKVYTGFININSASGRFYEAGQPRSFYSSIKFNYIF